MGSLVFLKLPSLSAFFTQNSFLHPCAKFSFTNFCFSSPFPFLCVLLCLDSFIFPEYYMLNYLFITLWLVPCSFPLIKSLPNEFPGRNQCWYEICKTILYVFCSAPPLPPICLCRLKALQYIVPCYTSISGTHLQKNPSNLCSRKSNVGL